MSLRNTQALTARLQAAPLSGAFREHPLQGALGELIGIRAAEVLYWRSARVWHDLLDISGPVGDVDIVVDADGAFPVHLETKCQP